ncbi:sugar nucleotide-binding protein [Geothrix sp. PMB-07]|uniref:SDR family oxidoreductase n=1 Tax=Geothrix sp. PMB-07 TaxID=3068640 RepID=UPI0027414602|nr:sugar nucleotide-binding protein [Geothrix sp. PMB-07]WLT32108.1 sugar nucleotide-binding protein [Geothrix sp. PMB-07]
MNTESRPLVITGSDGFLASRLVRHLERRFPVVGLGRRELDITSEGAVQNTLERLQPRLVIHAAAVSDTGACERDPAGTHLVNVEGSRHVARACGGVGAKLIFLSSDQVFNGNPEPGAYPEDRQPVPNTAYGRQKREAEGVVQTLAPDAVVLRLTWLFDCPQRLLRTNANLVWNVLRAALRNQPLTLPTREFRGLTYVHDLVERFDGLLDLPGGTYHAGSENDLSTYEAGALVLEELGLSHRLSELLVADDERFRNAPRDLRISSERLAFPTAAEGIRRCVQEHLGRL